MKKLLMKIATSVIGRKLKAGIGGLLKPTDSEFWAFWGSITAKGICFSFAPACVVLTTISQTMGFDTLDALFASAFAYAALRVTSKMSKA